MDPLVEQEYRNQVYSVSSNDTNPQHHPPQPQQQLHDQDQRSNYYTYYNFPEDFDHLESIRSNLKALDEKALQFQKQPHNNIINTTALSMFSKLPDEIILGFFKWSVLFDHSLIQTLSSVCKRFFILTR